MTGQKIVNGIGKTLLVLGGLLFLILYFGEKGRLNNSRISFAPRPAGELFRIFTGEGKFPKFTLALIEPRDVKPRDAQTLTVRVEDPAGVESVFSETELDHTTSRLPLRLAGGTATSGSWTNSWVVYDTHSKIYRTKFIAKNHRGETREIVLAWSDPCTPPLSGTWTIDSNCTITQTVDGADNGNITFSGAFTMTISTGVTVAFNPGSSISLGSGAIALSGTAQIRQTYLWILDTDNDGYYDNLTSQLAQDTQPASYRRRYTASGSDCASSDSTRWQNLTGYQDSDNDTWTTGGAQLVCSGASLPSGWRSTQSSPSDCLDSAGNVYPTNGNWYTASGPNGWDYNCSGGTDYQYGTTVNLCGCNDSAMTPGYGTNPGCGAAGTYYTGCASSLFCGSRSSESYTNYNTNSVSQTQACH